MEDVGCKDCEIHQYCGDCANFLGGLDWGLSCKAFYMRVVAEDTVCDICKRYKPKKKQVVGNE